MLIEKKICTAILENKKKIVSYKSKYMLNKRPQNCTIFVLAFVLVSDLYVNVHSSFIHNAAAKSLQSCPTLCDPIDGSPPGSPIPGILQARKLEWVCHFLLQCMKVKSESEDALSYPTLSDPMDCSPSGSSVHGIFQARVLEWGAIAFSSSQN